MKPEDHLAAFLEQLGLDLDEEQLQRTPERVTELFRSLFASVNQDEPEMSTFPVESKDLVSVGGIAFRSLCVHHLVPFFGTVDIAVAPDAIAAGFGSFSRLVEFASAKPQLQERLTAEIADMIEAQLAPRGVFVRTRARQMCVELREGGEATYTTIVARGVFEDLKTDLLFDTPETR